MKKLPLAAAIAALFAAPVAAAPPTVALKAAPTAVAYGGSTTLSGTVSSTKTSNPVDILAKECGQTAYKKLTTAQTSNGSFSTAVKPAINSSYEAKQKNSTSTAVAVSVSPALSLKKNGGTTVRHFTVTLTAAQSFVGKYVVFQRRTSTKWRTVKKVTLKTASQTNPPLTSASFTARIKRHPKVRVVLLASQAGTCYLPATSAAIRS